MQPLRSGSGRTCRTRGIEFVFAQFVDMYARPSAKLVPVGSREARRPARGRRRLRRLRRGRDRPGAERSRHRRDPRPRELHAGPVAAEPRALRVRRHGRGRGVAVLPAHDPAPRCSHAPRSKGYEFKMGLELEYFLVTQREDGSIEIADRYDTLEKPCYDMAGLTRRYDFLTTVSRYCNKLGWGNYANDHEDANGQFEQNFTYDDALVELRPRDLLPLHGAHARRAARDDRDLHAEAVHRTSPATAATSTCRSGTATRTCSSTSPTRAGSASPSSRTTSSAASRRTHARQRADRADGQLVQAAQGRDDDERRDVVAGVDLVRLQQPHADAPDPGPGARSRTERSTAPATRTSRPPPCSRRASTGSSAGSTRGSRTPTTCTRSRTTSYARAGSRRCRRTCSRRPASSTQDDVLRAGARARARRGLRRLLHQGEARRVEPLPRAGHAVGDSRVPDALLGHMEETSIPHRGKTGQKARFLALSGM